MVKFLIVAAIALLILLLVMVKMSKDTVSDGKKGFKSKGIKKHSFLSNKNYMKLYKFFYNNILTRRNFRKIEMTLGEMSVYTPRECRFKAVRLYLLSIGSTVGILVPGILVYRNLFVVLLLVVYVQVIKETMVYKQIDKVQYKIMVQLKQALSSVRDKYQIYRNIPDALNNAEIPNLLVNSFDDIYLILTSDNGKELLQNMYNSNPFRQVQVFAGICYLVYDRGDKLLSDGTPNFISAISKINEKLNMDILKVDRTTIGLKNAGGLVIFSVLALGLMQTGFSRLIPGFLPIYNSVFGYIFNIITIICSLISYKIIVKIGSTTTVNKNDIWGITKVLLKQKIFKRIVDDIKPMHGPRKIEKRKEIVKAISKKTIDHLYAEKIVCTVAIFTFVVISTVIIVAISKNYIYHNYTSASATSTEHIDAREYAKRKAIDEKLLKLDKLPNDENLTEYINKCYPRLDDYSVSEQAKRVKAKYISYKKTYYHWYFLLGAFILGSAGWIIPDKMLVIRAKIVKNESVEDVMQLQTLISILMYVNVDTLDTLYLLAEQSKTHKDALLVCAETYTADPIKAIDLMKKSDPNNPEFIRMCNKLALTVFKVSLKDAFSDIESDRVFIMKQKEMIVNHAIDVRVSVAKALPMINFVLAIFGSLVAPICIVAYDNITSSMKMFDKIQK